MRDKNYTDLIVRSMGEGIHGPGLFVILSFLLLIIVLVYFYIQRQKQLSLAREKKTLKRSDERFNQMCRQYRLSEQEKGMIRKLHAHLDMNKFLIHTLLEDAIIFRKAAFREIKENRKSLKIISSIRSRLTNMRTPIGRVLILTAELPVGTELHLEGYDVFLKVTGIDPRGLLLKKDMEIPEFPSDGRPPLWRITRPEGLYFFYARVIRENENAIIIEHAAFHRVQKRESIRQEVALYAQVDGNECTIIEMSGNGLSLRFFDRVLVAKDEHAFLAFRPGNENMVHMTLQVLRVNDDKKTAHCRFVHGNPGDLDKIHRFLARLAR